MKTYYSNYRGEMCESGTGTGEWVKASDSKALELENDRLKRELENRWDETNALAEIDLLRAEILALKSKWLEVAGK